MSASPGRKTRIAPSPEKAAFRLTDIRPCADNEEKVYLEGRFENIAMAEICEALERRNWNTLTMPAAGGVLGRLNGMLLILTEDLSFHFNNAPTREEALKALGEMIE